MKLEEHEKEHESLLLVFSRLPEEGLKINLNVCVRHCKRVIEAEGGCGV